MDIRQLQEDNNALVFSKGLELVAKVFHRINRILPENQQLIMIPAETKASDALHTMAKHGYSQLPVVQADEIIGVFSYRSFAAQATKLTIQDIREGCFPANLQVDDCLEQFKYFRFTDELAAVFDALEADNAFLVGTPERPEGIVTTTDFLNYLYRVASPFVMISEIELTLRALIEGCATDIQIAECAERCSKRKDAKPIPHELHKMDFGNYVTLITNRENFPLFQSTFGGMRTRIMGKLEEVRDLRNIVFHFKRDMTVQDYQKLEEHRNWLLQKARQAELSHKRRPGQ